MPALASPSNIVVVQRCVSALLQDVRCPLCKKKLCTAQILCIIEIKCTRSSCGVIVRIEPVEKRKTYAGTDVLHACYEVRTQLPGHDEPQ